MSDAEDRRKDRKPLSTRYSNSILSELKKKEDLYESISKQFNVYLEEYNKDKNIEGYRMLDHAEKQLQILEKEIDTLRIEYKQALEREKTYRYTRIANQRFIG